MVLSPSLDKTLQVNSPEVKTLAVEMVQRRAARFVLRNYNRTSSVSDNYARPVGVEITPKQKKVNETLHVV